MRVAEFRPQTNSRDSVARLSLVPILFYMVSIAYEAGDLLKPTPAERSDPVEPAASLHPIQPSR
jgi:hypothetical protein